MLKGERKREMWKGNRREGREKKGNKGRKGKRIKTRVRRRDGEAGYRSMRMKENAGKGRAMESDEWKKYDETTVAINM